MSGQHERKIAIETPCPHWGVYRTFLLSLLSTSSNNISPFKSPYIFVESIHYSMPRIFSSEFQKPYILSGLLSTS